MQRLGSNQKRGPTAPTSNTTKVKGHWNNPERRSPISKRSGFMLVYLSCALACLYSPCAPRVPGSAAGLSLGQEGNMIKPLPATRASPRETRCYLPLRETMPDSICSSLRLSHHALRCSFSRSNSPDGYRPGWRSQHKPLNDRRPSPPSVDPYSLWVVSSWRNVEVMKAVNCSEDIHWVL